MGSLSRTRAFFLLTFLVIIWGLNWPVSKFALDYSPPVLFAGIRTFIGGAILLLFALPRYKKLHFKQTWHVYLISSLFNIILYYMLSSIGLLYLHAGLFSSIVFLQPVLVGIFAWLWLGEAMYRLKIIGLILGFAGVFTITAGGFTGQISMAGILLALSSAVTWALGTTYVKKTSKLVDSVWLVTVQLIVGGVVMTIFGTFTESWSSIVWNAPFISSLLFVSIFVIAIGWLIYAVLVGLGEAGKVASYTFLIPVVAIVSSVLFMNEPVTLDLFVGLLLIVTSIILVNSRRHGLKKGEG